MQASIIDSVCVKLIPHCFVLWYESALFMVVIVRVFGILVCCVQVLCGCVMSFKVYTVNKQTTMYGEYSNIPLYQAGFAGLYIHEHAIIHYYSLLTHNYYML